MDKGSIVVLVVLLMSIGVALAETSPRGQLVARSSQVVGPRGDLMIRSEEWKELLPSLKSMKGEMLYHDDGGFEDALGMFSSKPDTVDRCNSTFFALANSFFRHPPCTLQAVLVYFDYRTDRDFYLWVWNDLGDTSIYQDCQVAGLKSGSEGWCTVELDSLVVVSDSFWIGVGYSYLEATPEWYIGFDTDTPDTHAAINVWGDSTHWENLCEVYGYCHAFGIRAVIREVSKPDHDVKPISIDVPGPITYPNTEYEPKATVANYGAYVESFDIVMSIDTSGYTAYTDIQRVVDLDAIEGNNCRQITFAPWFTGYEGVTCSVTVYTQLAGDDSVQNDTCTVQSWIGRTIYVDDDGLCDGSSPCYTTISEGVDTANSGDVVLVYDGTYPGGIDYHGDTIWVRSQSGNPESCIINCNNGGRGFHFHYGEPPQAVLEGVKIMNGYASSGDKGGDGGGIWCGNSSSPIIINCTLSGNKAEYRGGGMFCEYNSSPTLTSCTFSGNRARDGGGIYSNQSSPMLEYCTFSGNHADDKGGGMACEFNSSSETSPLLSYCIFFSNSAGNGGGIYCRDTYPTLTSCTFSGNWGDTNGGGMYCATDGTTTLENTIIAFSTRGGALRCEGGGKATLTCCDLSDNQGGDWTGCIADQLGINGNISEDPYFCGCSDPISGDYRLQDRSRCSPENSPPGCGLIGALGVGCGMRYDQNMGPFWETECSRPFPLSVPAGSSWAVKALVRSQYACYPTAVPAPVDASVDPPNFFIGSATIPTGFPPGRDTVVYIGTFTASQAVDTAQTFNIEVILLQDDLPSDNWYESDFFVTDTLREYVGYDDLQMKTRQKNWGPLNGVGVWLEPNFNWDWDGHTGYKLLDIRWLSAYSGSTHVKVYYPVVPTNPETLYWPPTAVTPLSCIVDTSLDLSSASVIFDTTVHVPYNDWAYVIFYHSSGNVRSALQDLNGAFLVYLCWEGISSDSTGGCWFDGPEIIGGHTFLSKDCDPKQSGLTHYRNYDTQEPWQDALVRAEVAHKDWVPPQRQRFIRCDYNEDGEVLTNDPIMELQWIFGVPGAPPPSCADAADYDDDGAALTNDPIMALQYIFGVPGAPPPQPPFGIPPGDCGPDPTEDGLDCASYPPCGTKGVTVAYKPSVSVKGAENRLMVGEVTVADGVVRVPVDLTLSEVVCGFDISLGYDVSSLQFKEVVGGDGYDFYAVDTREDGVVRIGCVPDIEMADLMKAGTHRVAEIVFTVEKKADMGLSWKNVEVYGSNVQPLSVEWVVKAGAGLPKEFALSQNYPNPFNPTTLIKYELPLDCQVKLDIYNVVGQRVTTLVDGHQKAGYKTATWNAQDLASGVYFYKLTAGDFTSIRKMVLLK